MQIEDRVMDSQERIGFLLRGLYAGRGYSRYRMSKFEEYDLYSRNKDFLFSDGVITFTDTNGRLMALKPDVTLSIVKNTRDVPGTLQKLYYHENVYRVASAEDGFREMTQVGVECMGSVDSACVAEVLKLAAESLRLCSEEFVLEISHLGILGAFTDAVAADEEMRRKLLQCVTEKNAHGITLLCREAGLPDSAGEPLRQLTALYGTPRSVMPRIRKLAEENGAAEYAEELARAAAAFAGSETEDTAAATISPESTGSVMSLLPAPEPVIFGAGHPMLISMKSGEKFFSAYSAPNAMSSGSAPNSWMPKGRSASVKYMS